MSPSHLLSQATLPDPFTGPFAVPREPRLRWGMLNPLGRKYPLPAPLDLAPTFHLFWARNALYHGLKVLGIGPGETVLVPAFHCTSVVEPILRQGVRVRFYTVHRDCSPDLDDLEKSIDASTRAILAIHYFGFPCPIQQFRAVCDRHGLALIEDCAHVLPAGNGSALGTFGDISIFSLRKLLPLYDGGQLVVNGPGLDVRLALEATPPAVLRLRALKNVVDRLIDDSPGGPNRHLSRLLRTLSAAGRRALSTGAMPSPALDINNYGLEFDPASVGVPMSQLSKSIVRSIDLADVIRARRRNYQRLRDGFGPLRDLALLHPDLPEGVCPWVFPVIARGWSDFHLRLRARGIPAFTWGDVVHPSLPLDAFPEAAFLYRNLVFLPVHQSLTEAETETIVESVADVLSHPS